ncbi:MAG: hypothetical protein AABZ67_07625 [Pseudomonadota bacterium]
MIRSTLVTGLSGTALLASADQVFPVLPDLWDRPRSARVVLDQPDIRRAVDMHIGQSGSSLVIHHAEGQEPLLHAEELRAWLIVLAISPERVRLSGGLKSGEPLKIEVKP